MSGNRCGIPKRPHFKLDDGRMIAEEIPRKVFDTSVTVGPVTIHGLIVWRSKNGHLRVFWPQHKSPAGFNIWDDTIELDPNLREEIEAAVIAAYRASRKRADKGETVQPPDEPSIKEFLRRVR
jgi:hypothetical protein